MLHETRGSQAPVGSARRPSDWGFCWFPTVPTTVRCPAPIIIVIVIGEGTAYRLTDACGVLQADPQAARPPYCDTGPMDKTRARWSQDGPDDPEPGRFQKAV